MCSKNNNGLFLSLLKIFLYCDEHHHLIRKYEKKEKYKPVTTESFEKTKANKPQTRCQTPRRDSNLVYSDKHLSFETKMRRSSLGKKRPLEDPTEPPSQKTKVEALFFSVQILRSIGNMQYLIFRPPKINNSDHLPIRVKKALSAAAKASNKNGKPVNLPVKKVNISIESLPQIVSEPEQKKKKGFNVPRIANPGLTSVHILLAGGKKKRKVSTNQQPKKKFSLLEKEKKALEKALNISVDQFSNAFNNISRQLGILKPKVVQSLHDPEAPDALILYSPQEEKDNMEEELMEAEDSDKTNDPGQEEKSPTSAQDNTEANDEKKLNKLKSKKKAKQQVHIVVGMRKKSAKKTFFFFLSFYTYKNLKSQPIKKKFLFVTSFFSNPNFKLFKQDMSC
ncbi:hypothetical protein RFI_10595 [Reticulomyxa filosa]|uniref:Uncharacterized protein n=1 Tax=Reticulomyxa filosa TaxID=46433 RepID=X6NMC2_RETFI|nr:hypothetical protein RFI_10595 [Reticulomyxa filosa]|eukprot:ETO26542.1 hypothetical protein RFI_10595 [Reticulomyxa filosa]